MGGRNLFSKMNFVLAVLLVAFSLSSCDPDGKKDCVWVLEYEPSLKEKVQEGFVPLCARNRKTMKQDCRLQGTVDQLKEADGRFFRYSDLEVKSPALPRTLVKIHFCK